MAARLHIKSSKGVKRGLVISHGHRWDPQWYFYLAESRACMQRKFGARSSRDRDMGIGVDT